MKYKLVTTLLVVAGLVVATFSATTTTPSALAAKPTTTTAPPASTFSVDGCPAGDPRPEPPCTNDDVVLLWNEQLLATIRANPGGTGPTISSRALGVLHTAIYDAWSAYDPAKATLPNGNTEQPANNDDKSKAISFAAYTTLVDLFPYRQQVFTDYMKTLYPNFAGDTTTPALTGIRAAQAVIKYRHTDGDGSNQTTNSDGTVSYPYNCTPTPTKTCYTPTRQWNEPIDPWRWQPLCTLTPDGVAANKPLPPPNSNCDLTTPYYAVQQPLTPQWGNVKPFASLAAVLTKVGPPPKTTTDIDTALADTDLRGPDMERKKVTAEYWADGPRTEFPPGHMAVFAQFLCRKMRAGLDTDVKMFFALGNAVMDAGIAAWLVKYKYDYWRPITAIHYQYNSTRTSTKVWSWLGPNQGFDQVEGEKWLPYQAENVVTPPFPEYVSGHSTFSAAGNVIMVGFTGSDNFGGSITISAKNPDGTYWSKIEPGLPVNAVTLSWPTYTAMADEAGMSRRYGGIHFKTGDIQGRALGNMVGQNVYSKAQSYFRGTIGYDN